MRSIVDPNFKKANNSVVMGGEAPNSMYREVIAMFGLLSYHLSGSEPKLSFANSPKIC